MLGLDASKACTCVVLGDTNSDSRHIKVRLESITNTQAHGFCKSLYSEDRYLKITQSLCEILNKNLKQSPYIGSDMLSVADIAVWPWVARFDYHRIDLNDYPKVKNWYLELSDRPAFQKGYAVPNTAEVIPKSM